MIQSCAPAWAALFLGILLAPAAADAATFVVDDSTDAVDAAPGDGLCATAGGGACTVRAAIMEANALPGLDTVQVPSGTYVLAIPGDREDAAQTGDLDVTDHLDLQGVGEGPAVLDGGGLDAVLDVIGATVLRVRALTVRNGLGGIHCAAGVVVLNGATVADNHGSLGGGVTSFDCSIVVLRTSLTGNTATIGGGIYHASPEALWVEDSTISGNNAVVWGGGVYVHSGPEGPPTAVTFTNSTVSGNVSTSFLGGIAIDTPNAVVTLVNTTVTGNFFSGLALASVGTKPPLTIRNSIIANNPSTDCWKVENVTVAGSHSLDSDGSCGLDRPGDLPDTDPRLGPLADDGGPTPTHALLAGSPAIDAGNDAACPDADQRGVSRAAAPPCDIGAFENVTCGDGTVDPDEGCDDGARKSGDCCSARCVPDPAGTTCDDSNACTADDTCDGTASCVPGTCRLGEACGQGGCDPAARCGETAGACSCARP